ncbi:MAG: hypothetical protein OXG15_07155 [Gammaproteobacteria bacterium]|nr:hypothetical protein [Gammaproteobacteria bacterium]
MNTELLKKVRDRIADESVHYNQDLYWEVLANRDPVMLKSAFDEEGEFCGTPCCIAGHAIAATGAKIASQWKDSDFGLTAQELLRLSEKEALKMFDPRPIKDIGSSRRATRQEAVAMLDRAIKTGKVKWKAIE